jgi:hypothetical protein
LEKNGMKILSALASLIFFLGSTGIATALPIDISNWGNVVLKNDTHGNARWTNNGTAATQHLNSDAVALLSDDLWRNTLFEGSFGVQTGYDDDYIGFVFGYTSATDYYLFDWKQRNQNWSGGGRAYEGFTLSHITGVSVNLWDHSGDLDVLMTDYGPTNGWHDRQMYDFSLAYTDSYIGIMVDNRNIFDLSGSHSEGKFGFYSYSQRETRFQSFTATDASASVPEPATIFLLGAGLAGLVGSRLRKKKKP